MVLKKRIFLYLLFIFISTFSNATDTAFLDSLKNVIATTHNKKEKSNALYSLSYEYGYINPRQALKYANQCLQLAKEMKSISRQSDAYNAMGNAYEVLANYDSALICHKITRKLGEQLKSQGLVMVAFFNIANCYKELGEYQMALTAYLHSYKLMLSKTEHNPRMYYALGEIYILLGDYLKAEYYTEKGLTKIVEKHDYIGPSLYINKGKCLLNKGKVGEGIRVLRKSVSQLEKYTDRLALCQAKSALGDAFLLIGQYKEAEKCYSEELELQKLLNNKNGLCMVYLNLACCRLKTSSNKTTEVLKMLRLAEEVLPEIKRNLTHLSEAHQKIASIYEQTGNSDKALVHYKLHASYKSSILNREKFQQINELQTKFDTRQKEQKIRLQEAELSQSRSRLYLVILICFIGIVTTVLLYSRYRFKQKTKFEQEKLQHERELIEKETEERTRISKDLHDELGTGLSKIALLANLTRTHVQEDKVANNIQTISNTASELTQNMRDLIWTLDTENATFDQLVVRIRECCNAISDDFPIECDLQLPINPENFPIKKEVQHHIFLTVKEALNNILKHSGASKIQVLLLVKGELLQLEIKDNGNGFNTKELTKGNGLKNMRNRIESIGGKFTISSSEKGTQLRFTLIVSELMVVRNHI